MFREPQLAAVEDSAVREFFLFRAAADRTNQGASSGARIFVQGFIPSRASIRLSAARASRPANASP